jgi:hypothetical protein
VQGSSPPSTSAVLPVDEEEEFDLCSDKLAEILADGPISRKKGEKVAVEKGEVDSEDGGGFELNDWV